jgi:hypothetical protein
MSVESRICRKKSLYLLNAEDMLEEYPELKWWRDLNIILGMSMK